MAPQSAWAYRRAEATMSSAGTPVMDAAHSGVNCWQCSLQLVVVRAPVVHELVVDEVLAHDDVEPCQGDAAVGAGMGLQPVFGACAPPGQHRVDGDDLRPHLHAHVQPVSQIPVAVGLQRLVAPHHQDVGVLPFGVGVAVGQRLATRRRWDSRPRGRRRRRRAACSTTSRRSRCRRRWRCGSTRPQ